jgi:hypothetical protein
MYSKSDRINEESDSHSQYSKVSGNLSHINRTQYDKAFVSSQKSNKEQLRDDFDFEDNDYVNNLNEISKDIRTRERKNNMERRRKLTDEGPCNKKNFNFEIIKKCSFVNRTDNIDPINDFRK